MSKKAVMTGPERKAQLLTAGAKLAAKHGAANVTRRMVAQQCGCAEGLVNVYVGDAATAQKAYARKAKALGLQLPDKATSLALGAKLRAHGPRDKRDTRKRSVKEVEAIKRKSAHGVDVVTLRKKATPAKKQPTGRTIAAGAIAGNTPARRTTATSKVSSIPAQRETKPKRAPRPAQPMPASAPVKESPAAAFPPLSPPEHKTVARAPKLPPPSA